MRRSVGSKLAWALTGTLLVAALGSCGLKGDLYLPEPEKAAAAEQTRNTGNTDATQAITTTSNGTATAADEDKETTAGKPSAGTPPQP
jgi:predicted small lipoprotein YifL